jgi:hypothetical protein
VGDLLILGEITIVAGRQFSLPTDLTATTNVSLPQVGVLAGYQLGDDRVQPGENLQVTLYWRAGREINHNYSVFVHLERGQVWAQHDGWPADGLKPTSTWAEREIIADQHSVPIGVDVPPGEYRLVVGMYDSESLQPLDASESNGQTIAGGRILLQPIIIYVP